MDAPEGAAAAEAAPMGEGGEAAVAAEMPAAHEVREASGAAAQPGAAAAEGAEATAAVEAGAEAGGREGEDAAAAPAVLPVSPRARPQTMKVGAGRFVLALVCKSLTSDLVRLARHACLLPGAMQLPAVCELQKLSLGLDSESKVVGTENFPLFVDQEKMSLPTTAILC